MRRLSGAPGVDSGNRPGSLTIPSNPQSERSVQPLMAFAPNGNVNLPVPFFHQEDEFAWCYAACAQMILRAYNTVESQCHIVGSVKGGVNCCQGVINSPDQCFDSGCTHDDIAAIYHSRGLTGVVRHEQPAGVLNPGQLRNQLRSRKPVEITLQYKVDRGSFHAIVIRGTFNNLFLVNDPLDEPLGPGIDFDFYTYQELEETSDYTWDETWTGFPPLP